MSLFGLIWANLFRKRTRTTLTLLSVMIAFLLFMLLRSIGAAFEGGNRAWESMEDVAAAALNSISGTRHTLYRHRGVDHFLDRALFQAAV